MLTPRTVIDIVFSEPFRPFRIHMASGRTFEIRHPEMIKVGRSSVTVYARPEGDGPQPDRWQEVSLMLLESIEPFDIASPTGSRGA